MRLGFAVTVLGRPQLKSHDSRRWQNRPHLSVSLAYLRDILLYLQEAGIRMYRMQSDLAPYIAHPDLPQFHHQVAECEAELAHVGQLVRDSAIRMSFHTHPYTVLNSEAEDIVHRSILAMDALTQILDGMGLDQRCVIVIHVGGVYDDHEASLERFIRRYERLPERIRARLVLENDEGRYSLADIHRVHRETGMRLVFDRLHFLLNNPDHLSIRQGLQMALATWPLDVTPKIHYSSPRTEVKTIPANAVEINSEIEKVRAALWRNHSDYINPFEFADFLRSAEGLRDFDVMLEAKAKDLAVVRLRQDMETFEPGLAKSWGVSGGRSARRSRPATRGATSK